LKNEIIDLRLIGLKNWGRTA